MKTRLYSLLSLLTLLAALLHAQDYNPELPDDFQRKAPELSGDSNEWMGDNQPKKQDEAEATELSSSDDKRILAEELNGLVLLANSNDVQKSGIASMEAYETGQQAIARQGDLKIPKESALMKKLEEYLAVPVTRKRIDEIIKTIILHYRENDRPLVNVYLPEQAMPAGIIQLMVIESELADIRVEGNKYFDDDQILSKIRTQPGKKVNQSTMNEDIGWINRNPFRQAELLYEEGDQPATTDAVVKVRDRMPIRAYSGYSDSGNQLTSFETLTFGFDWGQAFGTDDQLGYQFTTRAKEQLLRAHALTYTKQLPWRHTLRLIGSYSESDIPTRRAGTPVETESWQLGARYSMPFEWSELNDTLTFGADFKRSENGFPELAIFNFGSKTDVTQFSATYQLQQNIGKGVFSGGSTLIYSPGGIGGNNESQAFTSAGGGDPEYAIAQFNANYSHALPRAFTLTIRSRAQITSDSLLGSEQFSMGGYTTVRGYDASEASRDSGIFISTELRSPRVPWLQQKIESIASDRIQGIVFVDYATLSDKDNTVSNQHADLFSVGLGARYSIAQNLSARFDYGWQLRDSGEDASGRNRRAHMGLQFSF